MDESGAWGKIEGILIRIGANEKNIDEIRRNVRENYVTKDQYEPVKRIIYALIMLVLTTVFAAILKLVVL